MLVPLDQLLMEAEKENFAVMAPDFISIHMLKLELQIADELNTPIIASYPSLPIDGLRRYKAWTKKLLKLCDQARVPVCLHLDHGKSVEVCLKAIEAGFTSVMIDGSALPFEENVRVTKTIVEAARKKGVTVEGEIGHVGSGKALIEKGGDSNLLTDPEEAVRFAELTGVDCLAISIGTMHGDYKGEPKIDFERLQKIKKMVHVPLVLHGGSGTGDENIKQAVSLGIRKINLFTEFLKPYLSETINYYKWNPLRLALPINKAVRQKSVIEPILKRYFSISGSFDRYCR